MGWWGSELSNSEGYFTEPFPSLTLSFFTKSISAIKVVGDSLRKEYPVDYTIKVYDTDNNVLSEKNITKNSSIINITPIPENPTNATKIELIITRWSHPKRQARIIEFKDDVYSLEIDTKNYFKKNNPLKYNDIVNYIEVIAQPLNSEGEKLEDIKVIAKDEESIKEHGTIKFSFPSNPLIQTEEQALFIANTLLENFKTPRRNLELDWRGDPSLLLGDTVTIVDNIEKNNYKVVKQELEYAGYLIAKLSGRRVNS